MSLEILGIVVAFLGIAVAIVATVFAYVQSKAARIDVSLTQRDLSLTAYANAVQGLLEMKSAFAKRSDVFAEQVKLANIEDAIPDSMKDDMAEFLLFASGMWSRAFQFSSS